MIFLFQSLLIQGRGKFDCASPTIAPGLCNATLPECNPYFLTVVPGKTYRLRIGSLTALSALSFEIEVLNLELYVHLILKVFSFRCTKIEVYVLI